MAEGITEPKYEGKVSAKCRSRAEQVWPCIGDFCNAHKWFPAVAICYKLEGVDGQPGLIRYCQLAQPDGDQTTKRWAHEKLVSIDPIQRSHTYQVMENNIGFHSYAATGKVIPINGDDQHGCEIEWSYTTDSIDGWKFEDFLVFAESVIHALAEKIDKSMC